MGRAVTVIAIAGLCGAAACVSLAGLSGGDGPKPNEAGDEPAVDAPIPVAVDPCPHALPPPPPATDDDPKGDIGAVVVAVGAVSLRGETDGGKQLGYDLDGVCTCFPDKATAHAGGPSCIPPDGSAGTVPCDGDGGADTALTQLLAAYPGFLAGGGGTGGGPTLLLKITQYNGRANDKAVFVGIVASPGIYDTKDCPPDGGVDAGAPPFPPTGQGCDRWTLDPSYVFPGTSEPSNFLPAYVADHVLVVPPSLKPVNFVVGGGPFPLANAIMTGHLVALDDALAPLAPPPDVGKVFRLDDATLAGRSATGDTLRGLAASQAVYDGGPLCGASPELFKAVKAQFVCPNADLANKASLDFTDVSCDAISIAVSFSAAPARFGSVRAPNPTGCLPPTDPSVAPLFDCNQ